MGIFSSISPFGEREKERTSGWDRLKNFNSESSCTVGPWPSPDNSKTIKRDATGTVICLLSG